MESESLYSIFEGNMSNPEFEELSAKFGVKMFLSAYSAQGSGEHMEDYHQIAYKKVDNSEGLSYLYIGVFDGHGGPEAAKFAWVHLLKYIVTKSKFWSTNDDDIIEAMRTGFSDTQSAMMEARESWPWRNGLKCRAGTTASIAFIRNSKIYIGHLGDSGIVLGREDENSDTWLAKKLTVDHKPNTPEERERIINAGGNTTSSSIGARAYLIRLSESRLGSYIYRQLVEDPYIAVSRALGDFWSLSEVSNQYIISSVPDISVHKIELLYDRCLIFGTDGLWDIIKPKHSVKYIQRIKAKYETRDEIYPIAELLTKKAIKRKKRTVLDNITTIIVMFKIDQITNSKKNDEILTTDDV